ncbi:MAG: alanine--tRNA ligase [Minisyncoccia bacterium]|jgi:alanyl-tRNA synthetase
MNSAEIRRRFLAFFEKRGHAVIPSASLVTSDEKGVTNPTLFNTAGMQPLIPFLLGKPHPLGNRLVDIQKCLRTVDLDDVGDAIHATFFEMLGNWSLGDYFKKEAINWSYEFLTDKNEGLGLDPKRLYITVFEGDANAPKDDEAADIWREVFKKNGVDADGRIFFMGADKNWWEAGENGPCGPDTEMYYDIKGKHGGNGITKEQFLAGDEAREIVEVWNDVFMQYEKKDDKVVGKLAKPSVDTGAGLERMAMTMQNVDSIYDIDSLRLVMERIKEFSKNWDLRSARIMVDHTRASIFLIADGITPSNVDRGYVLRKLIRRAVRYSDKLGIEWIEQAGEKDLIKPIVSAYKDIYPEMRNEANIRSVLLKEETRFRETIKLGLKEFEKGVDAFTLFSSYGFPLELTLELAKEKGVKVDIEDFEKKFKAHQELSRAGAEQRFKGGLADASDEMVVRYHTATHLLHQALHDVLGESVGQKGSNITPERLRFDFSHGTKMTDEEKKRVEDIVNGKIAAAIPVNQAIMPRAEAEKTGARHFFGEKYGDQISIYFIGDDLRSAYSKEFCGGPHVKNTRELAGPEGKWRFKIQKEEAVAQGVRRIRAVLG